MAYDRHTVARTSASRFTMYPVPLRQDDGVCLCCLLRTASEGRCAHRSAWQSPAYRPTVPIPYPCSQTTPVAVTRSLAWPRSALFVASARPIARTSARFAPFLPPFAPNECPCTRGQCTAVRRGCTPRVRPMVLPVRSDWARPRHGPGAGCDRWPLARADVRSATRQRHGCTPARSDWRHFAPFRGRARFPPVRGPPLARQRHRSRAAPRGRHRGPAAVPPCRARQPCSHMR